MPITQKVSLLPPAPDPAVDQPAQFSQKAAASVLAQRALPAELNAFATQANVLAGEVNTNAIAVAAAAASATTAAANAARDAATAASAPGTNATSSTSMALSLGSKTFTLAQSGKLFGKGNTVTIAAPTGDNWMAGSIAAFNSATGEMTVNVTNISGSGTFAAWTVSLSGAAGLTGVVNELRANNIASASTVNLNTATGNLVHITGTTTINAFTLTSGAERSVIFDGALTLTNSAGLLLPGGANIAVAPGDRALVRGDSNGAIVTHYQRASGLAVKSGAFDLLIGSIVSTPVANIDYLNIVSPDYDVYLIRLQGLRPSVDANFIARFAVAGVVDSGAASYGNANLSSIQVARTIVSSDPLGVNITLEIKNANSASLKSLGISSVGRESSGQYNSLMTEAAYMGQNPISGIRIFCGNSANIVAGSILIYGVKNRF